MRRLGACVGIAVVLAAAGVANAAAIARPRNLDELKARIARVLDETRVPGVGLALVGRDGVLWAGGVGLADRAAKRPVTADTMFRVGSITKSFVALALVKLSEEGRLSLDARVSSIAPELAIENRWDKESPITVAELLEHTAGFDDMHFNELYAPLAVEKMPLGQILAKNPRSRVARWRPGSRFSYANPGYTVAAYLIEKVSGRSWVDYIHDELLVPLGMTSAALRWSPEVDRRLARGYVGDEAVPYRAIWHHPAGNLMASPRELAALVQLWLNRGRVGGRALVSAAGMERTERSETNAFGGLDTDYGLGNYGDTWQRARMRGHDGGIDGFLSSAKYMPDRGVGYVMLLNSTSVNAGVAYQRIRELIAEYLVPEAPAPPPRVEVPVEELRGWAGDYHVANPRMALFECLERLDPRTTMRVRVEGSRVLVSRPYMSIEAELIPIGGRRFRLAGHSGSAFQFGRDRQGRRVLVGWTGYQVEQPAWVTAFFHYAPTAVVWLLLSALALPLAALLWRRRGAKVGWWWPLVAAVSFFATPWLFLAAALQQGLGERNAYTVGVCAATIALAVSAAASLVQALARMGQPLPIVLRLHRLAVAVAASGAAAFFFYYGLVGIRLWSY